MREAEPFYPVGNRNRVIFPQPPGPGPLAPSDYPVRDGNPMAETPIHRRATVDAAMALELFFEKRSDVYVGCDMLMYYREGDVNGNVVPDVWVAFGVPKLPERNNWLIWLEGKGPDFVLEITSENTELEDEGRGLGPDGKYRDLVLKEHDGVLCHQSLLRLELCLEGGRLFYFDPLRNVRLLTPAERDNARQTAEAARQAAEKARQTAEAERDLEARLRREEAAARQAAEARVAELERRLCAK